MFQTIYPFFTKSETALTNYQPLFINYPQKKLVWHILSRCKDWFFIESNSISEVSR